MGTQGSFYAVTGPAYQGTNPNSSQNNAEIVWVVDGAGLTIGTGVKGDFPITFGCTINSVIVIGDQTGSVVVDILKAPLGATPVTSICGADLPTIVSGLSMQDVALTGWNKTISPLDVLRPKINSVTAFQRLTIVLQITKG